MVMDPKLVLLLADLQAGKAIYSAEYLRIDWATGSKYYGTSAYGSVSPFRNIKKYTNGNIIEPRIMGKPFQNFEINGDIKTENIPITFDDSEMTGFTEAGWMKSTFDTYGTAYCQLFIYYPQYDYHKTEWFGQVLKPTEDSRFVIKTMLTNGYRSRERFIPNRATLEECSGPYGSTLDTLDKVATNICPSDIHLKDGTIGNPGFKSCPQDPAGCLARLGTSKYYPGLKLRDIPPIPTGSHPGETSISKPNTLIRSKPNPWIFGTVHLRNPDILISRRNPNTQHPEDAWIEVVYRIGEAVQSISNLKINGKIQQNQHWTTRLGQRGQPGFPFDGARTQTASGTATLMVRYGYVDPNVVASSLEMECDIVGYNEVAVWTDTSTFTRKFSDDRLWCLIEMYTNQKAGLKYESGRFWIDKALIASEWTRKSTTFTFTAPDGETRVASGRRTTLDAICPGKAAIDVIQEVCNTGRLSVPFQEDGKYSIVPFRVFTEEELDEAIVFSDHGPNENLIPFDMDSVRFTFTPDDKLPNELSVTFNEQRNFDIPRTIVGNDRDQQYKASKILGDDAFSVVPKEMTAFGVRSEQEALKILYYWLWYGEGETGGTKNNCFVTLRCPVEWTHALPRYMPFRLSLESQTIPTGPTGASQIETATAAGTASSSGNITVTVTAAEMEGGPDVAVTVPILSGDTPAVWAKKVVTELRANGPINRFFFVRSNGAAIILTKRFHAANDGTMNIAIAAGTTGITPAASSANTLSGVADASFEWFRCMNIKKIDQEIAEVYGVAYNRESYEAFEVESVDPPTPGFCTLDADCPDGYVCRDGVCVPEGPGPICPAGPAIVTYNAATGSFEAAVPPC